MEPIERIKRTREECDRAFNFVRTVLRAFLRDRFSPTFLSLPLCLWRTTRASIVDSRPVPSGHARQVKNCISIYRRRDSRRDRWNSQWVMMHHRGYLRRASITFIDAVGAASTGDKIENGSANARGGSVAQFYAERENIARSTNGG